MVAFGRYAREALLDYDMWTNAYRGWPEVPWRRSAMEVLPSLVGSGTGPWEHASVLDALARCAQGPLCMRALACRFSACHCAYRSQLNALVRGQPGSVEASTEGCLHAVLGAREAAKLDEAVRRLQAEGASLESKAPAGLPRSHWWWHLSPAHEALE